MKEMANMLKDNLEGSVGDIYRRIFETQKNNKQGVDIEGVFTIIEYLRNKDKYVSQNDILSYNLGKSGLSLNDVGYDLTELQELNRKMRSFVRNACVLNSSNTSKLSEVYSHFGLTNTVWIRRYIMVDTPLFGRSYRIPNVFMVDDWNTKTPKIDR